MKSILNEFDIVVVGGGFGGVCASIAAAREGARTALVEQRAVLGGNGSSLIRVHVGGASDGGWHFDARESGIIEELRLAYSARDPENTCAWIDAILLEKCKAEQNLVVFLNTTIVGMQTEHSARDDYEFKILECNGIQQDTETEHVFRASMFIDGSGDGVLGALARATWRVGRESKAEFNESMAPDEPDQCTLGSSILFEARDRGMPVPFQPPSWANLLPKDYSDTRPSRQPRGGTSGNGYWHESMHVGWWWIEYGGTRDTIADNECIKDELHAILYGLWDHVKNSGDWRYKNAATYDITWIGQIPGKRESRRLIGDYILNEADILNGKSFDDAIAVGGWSIDLHPPEGFYSEEPPCVQRRFPEPYAIPYRCIYSSNVENLFMASRCISVSHVAHGSTRLQGTLAVVGQAAGIAAAACMSRGVTPRTLGETCMHDLQQALIKHDGYLLNVRNDDPGDIARRARVTASSSHPLSFEQAGDWIPLLFPVAQQFPAYPAQDDAIIDEVIVLIKNDHAEPVTITGRVGISCKLGTIDTSSEKARLEGIVPASNVGWISLKLDAPLAACKPADWADPCLFWFAIDSPDSNVHAIFIGKDPDHYPGFRTTYFDEDAGTWKVPRFHDGATFFTPIIKARGVFTFKIPGLIAYPPESITNGFHRPCKNASNLWRSDPAMAFPQEIILEFQDKMIISEVHVTTDTGLDKAYTHEWSGDYNPWPEPGKPPRCPKDFDIIVISGVVERTIARITGNFQRKIVIKTSPVEAEKVKLVIHSTNGGKDVGIYEIRVY